MWLFHFERTLKQHVFYMSHIVYFPPMRRLTKTLYSSAAVFVPAVTFFETVVTHQAKSLPSPSVPRQPDWLVSPRLNSWPFLTKCPCELNCFPEKHKLTSFPDCSTGFSFFQQFPKNFTNWTNFPNFWGRLHLKNGLQKICFWRI